MAEATIEDTYDDQTKEQLHDELAERALPVSGDKQELIDRLREDDRAKSEQGQSAHPEGTAAPAGAASGLPAQDESTTPEIGGEPVENADEIQGFDTSDEPERGGRQAIDYERAKAEQDERDAVVEYEPAVYVNDDSALLLREIAEELGLTRQEDYNELTRLNAIPLDARIDAGDEVRLPANYSYVDVEHVTGGGVKQ
jgi:hypothetical protein